VAAFDSGEFAAVGARSASSRLPLLQPEGYLKPPRPDMGDATAASVGKRELYPNRTVFHATFLASFRIPSLRAMNSRRVANSQDGRDG
jgi:hypothetical protein